VRGENINENDHASSDNAEESPFIAFPSFVVDPIKSASKSGIGTDLNSRSYCYVGRGQHAADKLNRSATSKGPV
jgi:hypothetical protein